MRTRSGSRRPCSRPRSPASSPSWGSASSIRSSPALSPKLHATVLASGRRELDRADAAQALPEPFDSEAELLLPEEQVA
jgi:hypothetical protein